ncbi:MAG: DUF2142 domain-containing protein [Lachnospiraceae bacterium]|nr:DUF2142 domain-containing protein [Lachnospiraceae bacterium]
MNKKKWNWFTTGLVILLAALIISTIYCVAKGISEKEYISYSLSIEEKEYFAIGYGDYDFKMIPVAEGIEKYHILLQENVNFEVSGSIGYAIRTVDGIELTNGILNVANLRNSGVIEILINDIDLLADETYIIRLYSRITGTIKIALDKTGEPCNKQIFKNSYMREYFIVLSCMLIVFLGVLFITYKYRKRDGYFVAFSLFIGSMLIILLPPCTAPDEFRHFLRAYTISEGMITCETYTSNEKYYWQTLAECEIPSELFELKLLSENNAEHWTSETNGVYFLPEFIRQIMRQGITLDEMVTVPYHGTAGISPIAYIPQIIFILIAKLLKLNALGIFYMGRMGNLVCGTFLVYAAKKICPRYDALFTILFFIPGLAFLRSSCSTDSFLWGVSLLLIAYILHISTKEDTSFICWKTYLKIAILASIIALIKLPYILVVCMLFFVDVNKFGKQSDEIPFKKRKRQFMMIVSILTFAGVVYLISNNILTRYSVGGNSKINYVQYLLENPLEIGTMLINTFFNTFLDNMKSAFSFPSSGSYFLLYMLVLLYFGFGQGEQTQNKENKLAYTLYLGLGMWLAILGTFYFIGPAPDLGYIWGVQGRYIFPILPLMGIGLSNCSTAKECETRTLEKKYYYYIAGILMIYTLDMYGVFWIG